MVRSSCSRPGSPRRSLVSTLRPVSWLRAVRRDHEQTMPIRAGTESDLEQVATIKVANWAGTYRELIPADVLARFIDLDHAVEDLRTSIASPDALFLVAQDSAGHVGGFSLALAHVKP